MGRESADRGPGPRVSCSRVGGWQRIDCPRAAHGELSLARADPAHVQPRGMAGAAHPPPKKAFWARGAVPLPPPVGGRAGGGGGVTVFLAAAPASRRKRS